MRRIKESELKKLSEFIIEQFWEKEEMQQMFKGFNEKRAKKIATNLSYSELLYMYKKGDIFIYDDNITGAIIGIDPKKLLTIQRLFIALKSNKILKELSKEEINLLKENTILIKEVHSSKWFKKYCKNPYYFAQFGIEKEKRGQGIARKMLEKFFEYVKQNYNYIVLETLTDSNVAMYEHFGFEIKEIVETKNKELKEYRMIKKLDCPKQKLISFGKLSENDIENSINDVVEEIDNILK